MGKFEEETGYRSQISTDHHYFQMVVAWGKSKPNDIIPQLLKRIDADWAWCLALQEIVGKGSPNIPFQITGQMDKIVMIWQKWGKEKKFI